MATHARILAWKIHGPRSLRATVHGVAVSRTRLSDLARLWCTRSKDKGVIKWYLWETCLMRWGFS